MHWKTALEHGDCHHHSRVITQSYYECQLQFPPLDSRIHLIKKEDGAILSTIELPPLLDTDIEKMLSLAGLPFTGWIPGSHDWEASKRERTQAKILSKVQQMTQEKGRVEIPIAELRDSVVVDDFSINLLHMLQDTQGLIAPEAGKTVRLAAWREALQASIRLLQQTEKRATCLEPQIQLLHPNGYAQCWIAQRQGNGRYHVRLAVEPYCTVEVSVGEMVDQVLAEHGISSLGWSTTYGISSESLEPRDPAQELRERQKWLAEMKAFSEEAQYTVVSATLLCISFRDDPGGEKRHLMDTLMRYAYEAYPVQNGKSSLCFGFEDPQNLEKARAILHLPMALQAGPRPSVDPLPVKKSGKPWMHLFEKRAGKP